MEDIRVQDCLHISMQQLPDKFESFIQTDSGVWRPAEYPADIHTKIFPKDMVKAVESKIS